MRKISINTKLVVLGLLLVLLPALLVGYVGYNAAEKAFTKGTEDRLQVNAKNWKLLIQQYDKEISLQETTANQMAKDIVTAQAKSTYFFLDHEVEEFGANIPDNEKKEIFEALNKQTVGKTGYIWILDYNGTYILSKGHQRDGENIWQAKDNNGVYFVQELISIGRGLKGDEIGYLTYPWQNKGETAPRNKISAVISIPELGWVVGASTYYDDLVDMKYREKTVEEVKDLISKQIIGKSGYIWVVDGEGNYVVSKNRIRDGESIWNSQDTDGSYFIQEMIKKAKLASSGKKITSVEGTDIHSYPWLNNGETTPRMKAAGVTYYAPWDWTIGVSAYYDDFAGEETLGLVRNALLVMGVICLILGIVAAFFVARAISKPIKKLTETANKINDGDFNAKVDVTSNDEVGDLAAAMEGLVMGIKGLKQQQESKDKKSEKESSKEKNDDKKEDKN